MTDIKMLAIMYKTPLILSFPMKVNTCVDMKENTTNCRQNICHEYLPISVITVRIDLCNIEWSPTRIIGRSANG